MLPRLAHKSVCQAACVCTWGWPVQSRGHRKSWGSAGTGPPAPVSAEPRRGRSCCRGCGRGRNRGRNSKASARLPERRGNLTQRRRDPASVIWKLPELSQEPRFCLLVHCWGRGAVRAWQSRRLVIFSFSYTSVLCNLGKSKVLKGVCSWVSNSYISNVD